MEKNLSSRIGETSNNETTDQNSQVENENKQDGENASRRKFK